MNAKKIVICGNYGATNIGDEAILGGLINLIKYALPNARITVLSANPEETFAYHKVKSEKKIPAGFRSFFVGILDGSFKKTLRVIKECDYFILGGGGLFTDEKFRAIIIWWLQAQIAYHYKKPLLCLGHSIGPLRTSIAKFLTKRVFSRARAITVRDKASSDLLHSLGVPTAQIYADFAFALSGLPPRQERAENYIVFSVRPWIKGDSESLYKICAHFIELIWNRFNLRTILLPFQYFQDDDTVVLNKIFAHVKIPQCAEVYEFNDNLNETLTLINNSKAVVGMRLHSLIFSTILAKPFIALSYSDKVTNFLSDMGMGDFCLNWENLTTSKLEDTFEELILKYDEIHTNLIEQSLKLRASARKHEELLTA